MSSVVRRTVSRRSSDRAQQDVLASITFKTLIIEDDRVLAGLVYVVRHNLNSNDAAILATYLRFQQSLPLGSPACFLVAADQRLLRAAQAQGLKSLNPEWMNTQEIVRRLAGDAA